MTISQRLFMIMEERHISQKYLAEIIGVPASTVSAWKNNNSSPPIEKLTEISKALDVPVSALLDESDSLPDVRLSDGTVVESQNIFENEQVLKAYQGLSLKQKLRAQLYILELADEENS